jgi:hypothetical protein
MIRISDVSTGDDFLDDKKPKLSEKLLIYSGDEFDRYCINSCLTTSFL